MPNSTAYGEGHSQPLAFSETIVQRSFNVLLLLFALAGHASAETRSNYEIVARLSQAPGNVTVTGSGRIMQNHE